jgi:hypothetical protein
VHDSGERDECSDRSGDSPDSFGSHLDSLVVSKRRSSIVRPERLELPTV